MKLFKVWIKKRTLKNLYRGDRKVEDLLESELSDLTILVPIDKDLTDLGYISIGECSISSPELFQDEVKND